ncbi:MAG: carboxypeptidase regulatory-like domain-containing protein [Gammaproteobacteria bacterium]|nr:carboxypeptidase regulatory-like domain-containing protein [Gammaproteobacteria bacterium]MDH5240915.1 carboxypeptidase regulatory-like domain-containing protein [Gammaproteobacteria bacterium]MDH5261922.1 carboxypeptidase regulatory-like domain-containing protein [Gammaproteobacteria bacterium]MDH5583547.1 carboxypeptidase regulatory-like domain-containing protein [Gammaproteobacteria bacterium]
MTLSNSGKVSVISSRAFQSILRIFSVTLVLAFFATNANAQQTGEIAGQIVDASGAGVAGISIEASSDVLPQPRTTTTAENGRYRFRLLPPGNYTLEYTFADGSTQTRNVFVPLQQTAEMNVVSGAAIEEIVVKGTQLFADTGQGSLKNAISAETIDAIPVGQDYRDMMKLIPGVQYSELTVRGPSAGGSGQDNTYQFDGVDVSLPLFGVLSSEPSSHDIAQVSVVRGGAKAVGFNRSGGFLMNTVSKRGTDEFKAEVGYQVQTSSMTSDQDTGSSLEFDEDRSWSTLSLGGPILRDRLYFYTSYYRPERTRSNSSNSYGTVGDYDNIRDEYFGKLTFSPTDNILLDASYRTSDRNVANGSISANEAASLSVGSTNTQDILILEGSWIVSDASSLSFKYTDYETSGVDRPDNLFSFSPQQGGSLNIGALDTQGYLDLPIYRDPNDPVNGAANADFNNFIAPYIAQFSSNPTAGFPGGGGAVGGGSTIDEVEYTRESFEIAFDHTVYVGDTTHDLHVGYQYMEVAEDLARSSNGWGFIEILGGQTLASDGVTPLYFRASVQQQSLLDPGGSALIPSIYSSSELQSIEFNDTIIAGDWTYNVGVMLSNDILYGQGLAPAPSGVNPITGFVQSPGTAYKMYEVDFKDMIQPRLGVNWDYSDRGSVYANYARYNPSASSLARAASWDRNLRNTVEVDFDVNGDFVESEALAASSGKWFADGLSPRYTNEFLVGTTWEATDQLSLRGHLRHRESKNFWEDTNNNARIAFPDPVEGLPAGVPAELYIPNLGSSGDPNSIRGEIGGSSYVIAELDGAFTKFWEASFEAEYTTEKMFVNASYTWSHYYGNFDQDGSTTDNDQAIFIGSSNIADGAGRQLWNLKEGNLNGDRRHMLKVYGYYQMPWDGRAGAYLVYQSGEPWEAWDRFRYSSQTGSSSDTIRNAEPAGSRTSPAHWQLDLNYTHYFTFADRHRVQLRADVFNVFDNQTGYNYHRDMNDATFGTPDDYYKPRRIQLALKYQFN